MGVIVRLGVRASAWLGVWVAALTDGRTDDRMTTLRKILLGCVRDRGAAARAGAQTDAPRHKSVESLYEYFHFLRDRRARSGKRKRERGVHLAKVDA